MSALPARVLAAIRRHHMVPPGGRVLVALSGGPDSVGLLHLLRELEPAGHLRIAGLLHLNHTLRAAASDDEAFCRALAARLELPLTVEQADIRSLARQWRTSLEDAGRRARHAFFDRALADAGADCVATGHTRDDQAETFLLQLMRGAGARGRSSISPTTGRLCRPLLDIRRAAVRTWLLDRALPFRDDESNHDPAFTRNRVRHRLIPYLEREFSPGIIEVLARAAAIARMDDGRLAAEAIEVAGRVVLARERSGEVDLDAGLLNGLHPAIGSRVARTALAMLAAGRHVGFDQVGRLLALCDQPDGSTVSLPGQQGTRAGALIQLRRGTARPFANSFHVSLSIPGEVLLETQGWEVSAAVAGPAELGSPGSSRPTLAVAVDREAVTLPLTVRSRRRGDRFRPAGMGGRGKKLQDLFVDRKVAGHLRDSVPLVVDAHDRIVWVVGEAAAEDFRVTAPSRGVLFLKARRLGGLG